ncbi:MAG: hypothetical protein ACK4MR_13905 [Erythrobacter cryptus]
MILRRPEGLGPGEVRSRQRARRQLAYLITAGAVGGVIGLITGAFDEGDGNLFAGNWAALALDPAVAILVAVLHAGGLGAAPHPFGVWLLAFVGMGLSYLYALWRH